MGGVGSGGNNGGKVGRPRKDATLRALDGNAGHRGKVLAHPSAHAPSPPIEIDEADAPNDLTIEERHVWVELAAIAIRRGKTLDDVKSLPFRALCINMAIMQRYARSVAEAGGANHRGMIQAVDRELRLFNLVDFGKSEPAAAMPAVDPMKAKYFGGA